MLDVVAEAAAVPLRDARAQLAIDVRGGDQTTLIRLEPADAFACPIVVEPYSPDFVVIHLGRHGLGHEEHFDDPEELASAIGEVVQAVIEGGYEEWLDPPDGSGGGTSRLMVRGDARTQRTGVRAIFGGQHPDAIHVRYGRY